jgi:hypothetical protein
VSEECPCCSGSCVPQWRGVSVDCRFCRRMKKPRGRSAPMALANGLCDQDCEGYEAEPRVGTLWRNETCADFGFAHSHDGAKPLAEITNEE